MTNKINIMEEENFYEGLGMIAGEEEEVKKIARFILNENNS